MPCKIENFKKTTTGVFIDGIEISMSGKLVTGCGSHSSVFCGKNRPFLHKGDYIEDGFLYKRDECFPYVNNNSFGFKDFVENGIQDRTCHKGHEMAKIEEPILFEKKEKEFKEDVKRLYEKFKKDEEKNKQDLISRERTMSAIFANGGEVIGKGKILKALRRNKNGGIASMKYGGHQFSEKALTRSDIIKAEVYYQNARSIMALYGS